MLNIFQRFIKMLHFFLITIFSVVFLSSCRGDKSSEPPVHLIQNMMQQTSYGPQSHNDFYADKMSSRHPVPDTVAKGDAHLNSAFYEGLVSSKDGQDPSQFVKDFPIKLTPELLHVGQSKFNVYCSPCHGYAGNNDGLVTVAAGGSVRPTNLQDSNTIQMPIGRIYSAVKNGVNNWNMPGFSEHLTVEERWAIVAYVRALQLSRHASSNDITK